MSRVLFAGDRRCPPSKTIKCVLGAGVCASHECMGGFTNTCDLPASHKVQLKAFLLKFSHPEYSEAQNCSRHRV